MRHLLSKPSPALALGLAALLATSVPASAGALDRIKTSGNLNLGYVDAAAPFSVSTGDNAAIGYSIDLCGVITNAIKEKLQLPNLVARYVPIQAIDAPQKLANGEVDIVCTAASDSLERRQYVSFSIPVFNGGIAALVRTDGDEPLMNVLSGRTALEGPKWRAAINGGLANRTFAVAKGSVSESWVRERIAHYGVVTSGVIEVDSPEKGPELLAAHQADAYFGERVLLQSYAAMPEYAGRLMVVDRIFTYEPLALPIARNDDDFRLVIDTALSQLYLSDAFAELYAHYFGTYGDEAKRLFLEYARH